MKCFRRISPLLVGLLLTLAGVAPVFAQSSGVVQLGCAGGRVNCLQITGAIAGASPVIQAIGPDTNIGITINGKGSGAVTFSASAFNATLTASSTTNAQALSGDLTLSGTGIGHTGGYFAGGMGNVLGAATAAGNNGSTTAGLIGKYSMTGTGYTPGYPRAGMVGEAAGFVTDAAVMGVVTDGDNPGLTVRAVFGVDNQVGPGATINYGLDLRGVLHDVYGLMAYSLGDIRLKEGMLVVSLTTAITANVTSCSAYPAQTLALTTNATGKATIWLCDGAAWQKTV